MKKSLNLLEKGFESSSIKTPEFLSFARIFKKEFKQELDKEYNVTKIEFNVGHFYISGFFQLDNEKIFYFSISDVRWFSKDRMLLRTAKTFRDFTGGMNNQIKLKEDMFKAYTLPKI